MWYIEEADITQRRRKKSLDRFKQEIKPTILTAYVENYRLRRMKSLSRTNSIVAKNSKLEEPKHGNCLIE